MRITSIQAWLILIFLAFFLLVSVSVAATLWGIDTQAKDALVINLTGRQRMLIQQMNRLALEADRERSPLELQNLQDSADTFEATLVALKNGGEAPYLPGRAAILPVTTDPEVIAQLDQIDQNWKEARERLDVLLTNAIPNTQYETNLVAFQEHTQILTVQADAAVRLYEAASNHKIARLRWFQGAFFTAALLLLSAGAFAIRRSVIAPLKKLGLAAEQIGAGDFTAPVSVSGPAEVGLLAGTLESMRSRLLASQEALRARADQQEARVEQRTSELEALYEVSRDISSRLDIQHVLRSVTEKAAQLLGAEVALLCLLDEEGKVLNLHANSGPREAVISSSTPAQDLLASQVLAGERALPCGVEGCIGSCGIIAEPYRKGHLAAPLRMGDRVIGALCVGSPDTAAFSGDAEALLTKLANSAAIALENARLYGQAERLGTLEERQRLAAEMHDGLAQTMNYLRFQMEIADGQIEDGEHAAARSTLERAHQAMDRAEREIRRAIASLQEDFPLYFTLQEQLSKLAGELSRPDLPVLWETGATIPLVLTHEQTEQVLRVAREALLNARQHSGGSSIKLRLEVYGEKARVFIEDNGRGFDPDAALGQARRQHFGLSIMRARAARIGGTVEIRSSPGEGTQVILSWQVRDDREPQKTTENVAGNGAGLPILR